METVLQAPLLPLKTLQFRLSPIVPLKIRGSPLSLAQVSPFAKLLVLQRLLPLLLLSELALQLPLIRRRQWLYAF